MNIQKWFEGEIVDVNDPEKLGRVKVRETLGHSNRVDSDDLFWSHVLMPPTGANAKGSGVSPVGLTEASKVIGFRINDTLSYVIGSVAYVPNEADHSVSSYARGNGPVKKDYIEQFGEKPTEYAAKYPYNKTITTESGHVLELDDTPKAERIHVYHKSGSYIEIFPDGTIITKSVKDSTSVTINDHSISVIKGDLQIVSNEGKIEIACNKDINIKSANGVVNIQGTVIGLNG
jgi:hypothetical protein